MLDLGLEDALEDEVKINEVKTEDGRKVLLSKDYRGLLDIVNAYKTLKHAVSKTGMRDSHQGYNSGGSHANNKGYMKMTIAA